VNKDELVAQLEAQLRELAQEAEAAGAAAAQEARAGATSKEKRADARVAIEYAGLARGQVARAERARRELDTLAKFRAAAIPGGGRVALGAVVEVEDEETGEGRSFFLAPAGAGMTITGPGGDGYFTVVTPNSPVGRAVLGRRVGEVFDVTVRGETREWTVMWIA
jgi:transcription elongation GreA/GreB family factor